MCDNLDGPVAESDYDIFEECDYKMISLVQEDGKTKKPTNGC